MKVIRTKHFPFGDYTTINIYGIIFTKLPVLNRYIKNHELIHTKQMYELCVAAIILILLLNLIFGISLWYLLLSISAFYIWYGVEYIIIRLFHKTQNGAYHDVSLEEEAYNNDNNLNYINTRKHFAWINYIKIRNNG